MNPPLPPYDIFPLGDSALTIDFGPRISEEVNRQVLSIFYQLKEKPLPAMKEAVPAYSTITIFYDPLAISRPKTSTCYAVMAERVDHFLSSFTAGRDIPSREIRIPVCYEAALSPDLEILAEKAGISIPEVVKLHTSRSYLVYMIGFLPGFAYMGTVDEKIAMPRKSVPEKVTAGSVGIAGEQTGIYPLDSPGGWQIIGRTPQKIFDPLKNDPILLRAGDRVWFYSISYHEFENYQGGTA